MNLVGETVEATEHRPLVNGGGKGLGGLVGFGGSSTMACSTLQNVESGFADRFGESARDSAGEAAFMILPDPAGRGFGFRIAFPPFGGMDSCKLSFSPAFSGLRRSSFRKPTLLEGRGERCWRCSQWSPALGVVR